MGITAFQELNLLIPGIQKQWQYEGGYAGGKASCDHYKGEKVMGDMRGVGQGVISLVL